jgi:GNAT superfamily N-acetyltransferase
MDCKINLYQRPGLMHTAIAEQIVAIAEELTGEWFTPGVPEDTRLDLKFQDALCLEGEGKVVAFIVFTIGDGAINLSLVGVRLEARGKGYGSKLMEHLTEHVRQLGFKQIDVWTFLPEQKPCYEATVAFYQKHGFGIDRIVGGLWDTGPALKLVKRLGGRGSGD